MSWLVSLDILFTSQETWLIFFGCFTKPSKSVSGEVNRMSKDSFGFMELNDVVR